MCYDVLEINHTVTDPEVERSSIVVMSYPQSCIILLFSVPILRVLVQGMVAQISSSSVELLSRYTSIGFWLQLDHLTGKWNT
jgi:hypothetical protein